MPRPRDFAGTYSNYLISAPATPTGLTVTGESGGSVAVLAPVFTWTNPGGVTTWTFVYALSSDFSDAVTVTGLVSATYTVPEQLNGVTVYGKVYAVIGVRTSLASAVHSVTLAVVFLTYLYAEAGHILHYPFAEAVGDIAAVPYNPILTGRNIVINGTFATDTIWVKGTNWTIAAGVAHAAAATADITQALANYLVLGKSYSITFTVANRSGGSVTVKCGSGASGTARSTNGTFVQTLTCTTDTTLYFTASAATLDIDDVIVTQALSASSSYPGAELEVDGDMELVGVASYTATNSATLTKETATPAPHGGTQWLKVLYNAVANPAATEVITTIGKRYEVKSWGFSGDGITLPRLIDSAALILAGSASGSWQYLHAIYIATGTSFRLQVTANAAARYGGWDDVSVKEINPVVGAYTGGTLANNAGVYLLYSVYFAGAGADVVNLFSTEFNSAFPDTVGTWEIAFLPDVSTATDATQRYLFLLQVDANNKLAAYLNGDGTFTVVYSAGGTSNTFASVSVPSYVSFTLLTLTWTKAGDAVKLFVNGNQSGSTLTGLGTWVGNFAATTCVVGAAATAGTSEFKGYLCHASLDNVAITAAEALTRSRIISTHVDAPANTVAPVIVGTPSVGNVLTCSSGTWTGGSPIVYTYQWKKGGVDIGAATATTYNPVAGDIAASITCAVTATNAGGAATATSAGTTVLADFYPYGQFGSNWTLVFSDEFSGASVDTTKWRANWLGASNSSLTPPINSAGLNYYDPAQATVAAGELALTADTGVLTFGKTIKSGILESYNHFTFTYGFFEARMWMPAGTGVWPAFWTDGAGLDWPTTGEIDVVEAYGSTDSHYHYHYNSGGGVDPGPGGQVTITTATSAWHTYAAQWQAGNIKWYYDGVEVFSYSTGIISVPHFVILNLEVNDAGISLPKTLRVDYVRVWQVP